VEEDKLFYQRGRSILKSNLCSCCHFLIERFSLSYSELKSDALLCHTRIARYKLIHCSYAPQVGKNAAIQWRWINE
jgi:hypothetical protein